MKKLIILLAFVCLPSFAVETESTENAVSTRLCRFWIYDFDLRDYVCRSLTSTVNLVEAREYVRAIQTLENRIQELESQVKELKETH